MDISATQMSFPAEVVEIGVCTPTSPVVVAGDDETGARPAPPTVVVVADVTGIAPVSSEVEVFFLSIVFLPEC